MNISPKKQALLIAAIMVVAYLCFIAAFYIAKGME